MQINDFLAQTGGLASLARELGVNEQQAALGAQALLPAILGGFQKQASARPAGGAGLGDLLSQLGGGALLDDVLSPQPTQVGRGDNVLGEIFGSRDVSRAVAQNASTQTGLDPAVLKKMLPMLAMLVTGFMAKQGATAGAAGNDSPGGLGGLLGGLLGGDQPARSAAPQAGGGLGGLLGALDANRDGNPLDDILRMAQQTLR